MKFSPLYGSLVAIALALISYGVFKNKAEAAEKALAEVAQIKIERAVDRQMILDIRQDIVETQKDVLETQKDVKEILRRIK